jgi:hypothetical protein
MTDQAIPNLPSRSFDDTAEFYGGFGFEPTYRDAGWMILRRGDLQLEYFPAPDLVPAESSFLCSVRVDDLDGLYEAIRASGVPESRTGIPRIVPATAQSWGQRVGFLVDLDGTQHSHIQNLR